MRPIIQPDPTSGQNLPLYIRYEFSSIPNQIQTDESEVILAFENGFGVVADSNTLPRNWRLSPPDAEGNALFCVPEDACVNYQYRKLRRRRYYANVRCRKFVA